MPAIATKPVTVEEYEHLPDPTDGTRLELQKGEVVAVSRPNWEHGEIAGNTYLALKLFLRKNPIGRVSVESGVITERGPDTLRGPDVSFIRKERMPLGERMNQYASVTPDLCVEVLSPSNTRAELNEKMAEYFSTGAKMVWVIDPDERSLTVYEQPDEGRVYKGRSTIAGGDVLPGFNVAVAELFDV